LGRRVPKAAGKRSNNNNSTESERKVSQIMGRTLEREINRNRARETGRPERGGERGGSIQLVIALLLNNVE
jgi:hypothetical protein